MQTTKTLHPLFIHGEPQSVKLPRKGSQVQPHPALLIGCQYKEVRRGLNALFGRKIRQWTPRLLSFDEAALVVYEHVRNKLYVRHAWPLFRLLEVRIKKDSEGELTLVFAPRSLNPLDGFVSKTLMIEAQDLFLRELQDRLQSQAIAFQLDS